MNPMHRDHMRYRMGKQVQWCVLCSPSEPWCSSRFMSVRNPWCPFVDFEIELNGVDGFDGWMHHIIDIQALPIIIGLLYSGWEPMWYSFSIISPSKSGWTDVLNIANWRINQTLCWMRMSMTKWRHDKRELDVQTATDIRAWYLYILNIRSSLVVLNRSSCILSMYLSAHRWSVFWGLDTGVVKFLGKFLLIGG